MPSVRFERRPILIGVVHLQPLVGAPCFAGSMQGVLEAALRDARALVGGGCDALIVENFGDTPFHRDCVPPETVAGMARALALVRAVNPRTPLGVNVLRNDARSALGLCAALELDFLRVNVHGGAAVTDQGLVEGRAAETLRERARLRSAAALWADAQVKHATPLSNESLGECVSDLVERALADGVIVSGRATGSPPGAERVAEAAAAARGAPVLVGSGLTLENAPELLAHARGAIVGTALKRGGRVHAPVEAARVRAFAALFRKLAPRRSR